MISDLLILVGILYVIAVFAGIGVVCYVQWRQSTETKLPTTVAELKARDAAGRL